MREQIIKLKMALELVKKTEAPDPWNDDLNGIQEALESLVAELEEEFKEGE